MDTLNDVILSLGSNLGERLQILEKAKSLIASKVGEIYKTSSYWESEPWGFESKEWFLNNCIWLKSKLNSHEVLNTCQAIEKELGKIGASEIHENQKKILFKKH